MLLFLTRYSWLDRLARTTHTRHGAADSSSADAASPAPRSRAPRSPPNCSKRWPPATRSSWRSPGRNAPAGLTAGPRHRHGAERDERRDHRYPRVHRPALGARTVDRRRVAADGMGMIHAYRALGELLSSTAGEHVADTVAPPVSRHRRATTAPGDTPTGEPIRWTTVPIAEAGHHGHPGERAGARGIAAPLLDQRTGRRSAGGVHPWRHARP